MMRLTRRYRFAALHRLQAPNLSEEANRALYGKCSNPHGHGHDYVLEVSVRGPVDPAPGRVADTLALDRLVEEHVLAAFDHQDLNAVMAAIPTTENLALDIRARLLGAWSGAFRGEWPRLAGVRLGETPRNVIEIKETP
jgi:6-pyruvoyltetrahydropterin/6-carboxytetrahydropterin synthase